MRRSSIPSPLTSPAILTAWPERSPAATPESLKPLVPSRAESSRLPPFPYPGAAEDHIARPGDLAVRVGAGCSDEEVIYPVAVDIPGRAHRLARAITDRDAREPEAVGAVEGREFEVAAIPYRVA
jgi:hypothetical protein